jgi:hypothetical protein
MLYFWNTYIAEQEQSYGNIVASRKPCDPYGFITVKNGEHLIFSWKTREKCTGFLLLGETYADFSYLPYQVMPDNAELKMTDHAVKLLRQDELRYKYAIIVSDGEWFGINSNPFEFSR